MLVEPLPSEAADPGLMTRIRAACREYAALWETTPEERPVLGPRVAPWRHLANARAARRLIDELAAGVRRLPDGERERAEWREAVRERLQQFGDERLGWPAGYRRLVFGDAFFDASMAFAHQARAFDPGASLASVWQALRNVWIANSLQMILGLPVGLTPGVFAYSMLYPVTDNLLDEVSVSHSAKRAFCRRLGQRLAGRPVPPTNPSEAAAFRLVAQIEEEFPRYAFAGVHESLLAIHRGQVLSLSQQERPELTDAQVLDISCEKGGSSVLADLYLVAGRPSPEEERFAFGYGVFLQLLDDLQDVGEDVAVGHQTLFTRAARRGPLDGAAARLLRFIDRVLDAQELLARPALADRKDLVRRNCRSLLVGAVVEQPRLFTRRFRRELTRRWPFSARAMRRLRRRAEQRLRSAALALQRRTGVPSLLDWLLAQRQPF
jgi:hypothetical protein